MKKNNNRFYIVIFFIIIAGAGMFSVAHHPIRISEMENRRLATLPRFTLHSLLTGEFQNEMEDGMKDQSMIKNASVEISVALDMLTGKQDRNDTYFNSDGTYVKMETDNDYNRSHLNINTRILRRLSEETRKPVDIVLVPPKGAAEPEKLPSYAPYINDHRVRTCIGETLGNDENVKLVPMNGFFNAEHGKYFYTDHHYNSMGAYFAVKDYLKSLGRSMPTIDYFSPATVGDNFHGSLYRRAPMFMARSDRMTLPSDVPDVSIRYYYGCDGRLDKKKGATSLYEPEYMFTEDKYSVYMGGNHGLAEISNTDIEDGPTLLIIKDSFANSAVPYLIGYYKKIVLIDLRYYSGKSVTKEIRRQNPDRIAVWYETLDYARESGFSALLR